MKIKMQEIFAWGEPMPKLIEASRFDRLFIKQTAKKPSVRRNLWSTFCKCWDFESSRQFFYHQKYEYRTLI